jgi:TonB family protein
MVATATIRMPPRPFRGPAVVRASWPIRSIVLSTLVHGACVALVVMAALWWRPEPTKAYFVNLVPAVPAQGSPTGQTITPTTPQRPPEPAPPPQPARVATPPPDLPVREVAPKPSRAVSVPDLPTRPAPQLPEMPARELPRVAAKPGQKELPSLTPPSLPGRTGPITASREAAPPPPPAPLGRPAGVAQGSGAAASAEGDFPFQWYLTAVQRKVYEQWTQPLNSTQGQKTVVVFEIARNGEVGRARVEKTSGDTTYDLAALRAVTDANPLPPLPEQYKGTMLRVHFGFEFTGRG